MMVEKNKRILVLDDDVDICRILEMKLSSAGFEVVAAQNIEYGFKVIEEKTPRCILLDIRFQQGGDGLTFLRRLRSFRSEDPDFENLVRKLPVIILTSTGEYMRSLFEVEGINGFIEKPLDVNDIKGKINSIFQTKT